MFQGKAIAMANKISTSLTNLKLSNSSLFESDGSLVQTSVGKGARLRNSAPVGPTRRESPPSTGINPPIVRIADADNVSFSTTLPHGHGHGHCQLQEQLRISSAITNHDITNGLFTLDTAEFSVRQTCAVSNVRDNERFWYSQSVCFSKVCL